MLTDDVLNEIKPLSLRREGRIGNSINCNAKKKKKKKKIRIPNATPVLGGSFAKGTLAERQPRY